MSEKKKLIRQEFRDMVFSRDDFKCRICKKGGVDVLDAHHITGRNFFPNGGYVAENGITLCPNCHYKAEYGIYGINFLYKTIESSLSKAIEADLRNEAKNE